MPKEKRDKFRSDSEIIGHDIIEQKLNEIADNFKAIKLIEDQKRAESTRKAKYFLEDSFDKYDWDAQVFIFGHVNYQVKVKNDFYPIEVGLVKYSINEGLMDKLYIHINSSPLPIGNENLARVLSEDTHQLPVNTNFGKSFGEAKVELTKFLGGEKPFVFTLNEKDDIAAVQYTFEKIMATEVHVVPLDHLFMKFYKALYKKDCVYDAHDILLNKDSLEPYDIGCDFHKDLGASKFCSLAK